MLPNKFLFPTGDIVNRKYLCIERFNFASADSQEREGSLEDEYQHTDSLSNDSGELDPAVFHKDGYIYRKMDFMKEYLN